METMFVVPGVRGLRQKLRRIEAILPATDVAALHEDYAGDPALAFPRHRASANSVHQLYHLARYEEATGMRARDFPTVVEWGGGYGSLARIFRRLPGGPQTYSIVDLPLLSCLQWLYLSTVLGPDEVRLLERSGDAIEDRKINLVPLGLAGPELPRGELFVSTWALSESSRNAQDAVVGWDWFAATRLLLAHSQPSAELPDAGRVGELARAAGGVSERMDHPRDSFYVFR
jgi:hypothetical protein